MPKASLLDKQALIYLVIRVIVTIAIIQTSALVFIIKPLLELGAPIAVLAAVQILIISPVLLFISGIRGYNIVKIVFLEIIGAIVIQAVVGSIADLSFYVPIAINLIYTYFVIVIVKRL